MSSNYVPVSATNVSLQNNTTANFFVSRNIKCSCFDGLRLTFQIQYNDRLDVYSIRVDWFDAAGSLLFSESTSTHLYSTTLFSDLPVKGYYARITLSTANTTAPPAPYPIYNLVSVLYKK